MVETPQPSGVEADAGGPIVPPAAPRGARAYGWGVTLLACGAVLFPITEHCSTPPGDNFPLSSYPMFAARRPAFETIVHAVVVQPDVPPIPVHYRTWAGGGMHDGRAQLKMASQDPEQRDALCQRIAARWRRSHEDVEEAEVKVVRSRFSLESYFGRRDPTPERQSVVVRCPLPTTPLSADSSPEPSPEASSEPGAEPAP